MDTDIIDLFENIKNLKLRFEGVKHIYHRQLKLEPDFKDTILFKEFNTFENDISDAFKRVLKLQAEVETLKTIFTTQIKQNDQDSVWDDNFDRFLDMYIDLKIRISIEKSDQNKLKNEAVDTFLGIGEFEIECEQDWLAIVLWKDWIESIKWWDFKSKVDSKEMEGEL